MKYLCFKVLQKVRVELKEWECIQLSHHKNIGQTIDRRQRDGWRLHTYQAQGTPTMVNHYLLFERETDYQ